MQIKAGTILKSTLKMNEATFINTTILIFKANENDVCGVIVNKIYPRVFNELIEFKNAPALPLFYGGPVELEKLFFIHTYNNIIPNSKLLSKNICWGGNIQKALEAIGNNIINAKNIKLFIGYCGWDTTQLAQEIKDGYWNMDIVENNFIF